MTITGNPAVYDYRPTPDYRKHGFNVKLMEPLFEGVPTVWTIHLGHGAFEIVDYYLPMDACAEAFQASGFRNFRVRPIELSSRRDDVDDRACWADLLNHPQAILIDCAKE